MQRGKAVEKTLDLHRFQLEPRRTNIQGLDAILPATKQKGLTHFCDQTCKNYFNFLKAFYFLNFACCKYIKIQQFKV